MWYNLDWSFLISSTLYSIGYTNRLPVFNTIAANTCSKTKSHWEGRATLVQQTLHSLLPPLGASQCNLRDRQHNRLLCQRASRLTDCNFIVRMLYSDMYWLTVRTFYCFVFVSHVEVRFDISVIKELIDWLQLYNQLCSNASVCSYADHVLLFQLHHTLLETMQCQQSLQYSATATLAN